MSGSLFANGCHIVFCKFVEAVAELMESDDGVGRALCWSSDGRNEVFKESEVALIQGSDGIAEDSHEGSEWTAENNPEGERVIRQSSTRKARKGLIPVSPVEVLQPLLSSCHLQTLYDLLM